MMKQYIFSSLLRIVGVLSFSLFLSLNCFAQTTLSVGELAIIGYHSDTPDNFSFVTFVALEAGTEIYFTDNNVTSAGASTIAGTEGVQLYTAPSAIAAGTVISFTGNSANFSSVEGSFALGTSSDAVIAFQGYNAGTNTVTTFLHIAGEGGSAVNLPAGLSASDVLDHPSDNGQYNGTRSGTASDLYTAINNSSNWATSGSAITLDLTSFSVSAGVTGTSTVAVGAGSEPSTIASTINAATAASLNFDFAVTDDGATSGTDTDDLLINQVIVSQGAGNDIADWQTVIAGAFLVNGDDSVAATVNETDLTFASIPTTSTDLGYVADNATKTFELKVFLTNPLPAGVDGSNLAFLVNRGSFSVESSGSSGFESGDGTDVESGATNNAIAVTATELRFSSVPSAVNIDTDFGLTVSATDANGNIDTDNTISVTLARGAGAGILSSVAGLTQSLSSGTFDWTDLQYNTTETFDITTTSSLTDATSSSIVAQNITTIAFQDFEGGADDWSFTPNPTTYNVSDDIWANVTTVGGTVSAANSGSNFWGMEDLENSNGGGAFDHTLTFATINTSSATSVSISFDYITDDFNGSDILKYEIFEDGVGQGQVNLPQNTDAWTTVSVNISDAADNAHIVITASQNGGSQHAGVDNFKIEGAVAVVAGTSTVAAGAGAEPSTISSLINAATDASLNFDFAITDDGATSGTDTDDLLINQVEISQGTGNDIADWTTVIAGAYLVNGDDSVAATVSASLLTFASIPTTSTDLGFVADNATKTFELKVYLANPLPAGVDGSNLAFSVNRGSFSVESSGSSGFESGNGTDVESGASNNAIAITATELRFSSVPSDVFVNTNFGLTVSATDANGNTDTDNTTSVTLARGAGAGTLSSTTGLTQSLSSGTFSWTDLQNNTIETFDITTTSSLTDATSSSITASAIPTLIIAEVADPSNNSNARFVKLYNNGTDTLDFDTETYFLSRQANGTSWGDFQLSGTLAPGATMVVATNSSNFNTAYGFTPDLTSGFISGNGDDTYAIFKDGGNSSGTLLDIYGEIDVDGTGDPWEYEDSRAVRIPGNTPNTTWTASEWVITSANVADFTPSTFGYYSASSGNLNTLATWGLNKDGSSTNPTDFTSANQQFHVYNNASPAVSASWTISGTNSKLVIGDGSTTISFGLASGQTLTVVNLEVQASGTLEANDGAVVTFSGDLINDGTITVKEDAAFIQSAASPSNSGSGTYEVERTAPDYKFHFNFWSSPLENLNIGNAFSSAQNIYGYNASTQAWSGANTAYTLAAGEGFIATGLSESATTILRTFSSTNAFNSGDIDVALTFNSDANDDNDWNLIGNPYPSGLSANSFLTDNSGVIDNAVYLWNSDGDDETSLDSDYATMNAAGVTGGGGGTTPSSNNIASCQGFFVQATGAGSVTFSNAQRTSTNNTFLRTQEVEMQRIWLGVSAQTKEANYPFTNEVLIGFMEDAENSKDKYDANKFKGHAHLSMYSLMEDKKLAIQGLPLLEDDQLGATRMVPIGIEVGLAGQYTFSINMLKNVPAAYDVLFYDALANTWTDLRAHSYTVPIKNTGEYNDRFSLHLVGNRVTSLPTDQPAAGIHVYAFESAVYIAPTAQVKGGIQVVITDLMGRTILDQAFSALSTKEKISLAAYPQGIYLVKVVAEEGKVVKRVYIK